MFLTNKNESTIEKKMAEIYWQKDFKMPRKLKLILHFFCTSNSSSSSSSCDGCCSSSIFICFVVLWPFRYSKVCHIRVKMNTQTYTPFHLAIVKHKRRF